MKSLVALTAVSFVFVSSGLFAGTTWTSKSGGDLNDPDNWGGELPAASSTVNFSGDQSAAVTASSDFTADKIIFGGGSSTFALDPGISVKTRATTMDYQGDITLTCGIFGFSSSLSVGANAGTSTAPDRPNGNSFTVSGENAVLGNTPSARLYVGNYGTNNLVLAKNGASVNAMPILGYYASSYGNTLLISGSSLTSGSHVYVGAAGSGNTLIVTNGANLTTTAAKGNVLLGGVCDSQGGGEGNVFIVTDGSTVSLSQGLSVGDCTSSNRCEIVGGSKVTCTAGVGVGGEFNATYTKGESVRGNSLKVAGAGTVLTATQVNPGDKAGAVDSVVEILDEAVVKVSGTIYAGREPTSCGSRYVVSNACFACTNETANATYFYHGFKGANTALDIFDGGRVSVSNYSFIAGKNDTAAGATVFVGKGSRLDVFKASGSHYIGDAGSGCKLVVDGGKANFAGQTLYVGNAASATGCALEVRNSGSVDVNDVMIGGFNATDCETRLDGGKLNVTGTFSLGGNAAATTHSCDMEFGADGSELNAGTVNICGDSQLTFKVPKGGYSSAPFKCSTRVRVFPNTVKIKVETHKHSVGGTYPLFACCSISEMKSAQWDIPADCELVYDDTAKVVSVKVPDKQPGMMLILR